MTYNFNFEMTATISAEIIQDMVKKCVEEQTGRRVKSVVFTTRHEHSHIDRFPKSTLNGCVVTFEIDSINGK